MDYIARSQCKWPDNSTGICRQVPDSDYMKVVRNESLISLKTFSQEYIVSFMPGVDWLHVQYVYC